jgi:hypothetical protein
VGTESKSDDGLTAMAKIDGGQQMKKNPQAAAFKKRHRGCSFCILDIESAAIPEFPPNEEVVGVITMEDVIEELLQVMFSSVYNHGLANTRNGYTGLGNHVWSCLLLDTFPGYTGLWYNLLY